MKALTIVILLFFGFSFTMFSQADSIKTNGVFYKFSLAFSLTANEDYLLFINDEDNSFFEMGALFINNTLGYQFDNRTSVGLNFEYDWHSKQGLHFFPAYISLQHNFFAKEDVFIRGGYGTLLDLGKSIEKGNMYKLGAGFQWALNDNSAILIGLDFTRKRFGYKKLDKLSTVSLFLEFMFL